MCRVDWPSESKHALPTPTHSNHKKTPSSFAEASERQLGQRGMDRVRGTLIGKPEVSLKYFEEAFTSQHWMMRIYRFG